MLDNTDDTLEANLRKLAEEVLKPCRHDIFTPAGKSELSKQDPAPAAI